MDKEEQSYVHNYISKLSNITEYAQQSINKMGDLSYAIGSMVISYQEQSQKLATKVAEILEKLASFDFDKFKINFYRKAFEEHEEFIDTLRRKRIFPPINFIIDKGIGIEKYEMLEQWILSDEIREYYLNRILTWKEKFGDEAVNEMVNEIEVAYKNRMSY